MLHVRPNLHGVDMSDTNAVFDALLRPLLRVPVFPGVMLPVVIDVCGMTLDDDDEELVTAGEQLLGLLRTHPDAFMRDGSTIVRTD